MVHTSAVARVLILDDDAGILDSTRAILEDSGFVVETMASPFELRERVRDFRPDIVMLDLQMPALAGDKLLSINQARNFFAGIVTLIFSGRPPAELEAAAARAGANGWISKGLPPAEFVASLERWASVAHSMRSSG